MELNESDFDRRVARGVHIVDFSAEWCPPCRALLPLLEKAEANLGGRATFAKVDTDRNQRLAVRFGIQALPTIVVLKDGSPVRRIRGLPDQKTLLAELGEAIGDEGEG
jgi:thioredoxin 1